MLNFQIAKSRFDVLMQRCNRHVPVVLATVPAVAALDLAILFKVLTPPPELEGRRFSITVTDWHLRLHFHCSNGLFHPLRHGTPELLLEAKSADFLELMQGKADADTLFFQRRLKISGDTELGLIVKNWLDAIERPFGARI